MDSLLAGSRPFLLVLACVVLEAALLAAWARRARRPDVLRRYLPSLGAAAGLVGAAALSLAGAPSAMVGLALLLALSAHVLDLLSLRP